MRRRRSTMKKSTPGYAAPTKVSGKRHRRSATMPATLGKVDDDMESEVELARSSKGKPAGAKEKAARRRSEISKSTSLSDTIPGSREGRRRRNTVASAGRASVRRRAAGTRRLGQAAAGGARGKTGSKSTGMTKDKQEDVDGDDVPIPRDSTRRGMRTAWEKAQRENEETMNFIRGFDAAVSRSKQKRRSSEFLKARRTSNVQEFKGKTAELLATVESLREKEEVSPTMTASRKNGSGDPNDFTLPEGSPLSDNDFAGWEHRRSSPRERDLKSPREKEQQVSPRDGTSSGEPSAAVASKAAAAAAATIQSQISRARQSSFDSKSRRSSFSSQVSVGSRGRSRGSFAHGGKSSSGSSRRYGTSSSVAARQAIMQVERERRAAAERRAKKLEETIATQADSVLPVLEDIIETMNGLEEEQASRLEVDAEAKRAFTALDEKIDKAGKGIPERFESIEEKMEDNKFAMLAKMKKLEQRVELQYRLTAERIATAMRDVDQFQAVALEAKRSLQSKLEENVKSLERLHDSHRIAEESAQRQVTRVEARMDEITKRMNDIDHGVFKIKMFLGVSDDAAAEGDGEANGEREAREEQKSSERSRAVTLSNDDDDADHSLDELGVSGIGGGSDLAISKVLKGSSVNGMPRHSTIFSMRMGGGGSRSGSWELESKIRMVKQDLQTIRSDADILRRESRRKAEEAGGKIRLLTQTVNNFESRLHSVTVSVEERLTEALGAMRMDYRDHLAAFRDEIPAAQAESKVSSSGGAVAGLASGENYHRLVDQIAALEIRSARRDEQSRDASNAAGTLRLRVEEIEARDKEAAKTLAEKFVKLEKDVGSVCRSIVDDLGGVKREMNRRTALVDERFAGLVAMIEKQKERSSAALRSQG